MVFWHFSWTLASLHEVFIYGTVKHLRKQFSGVQLCKFKSKRQINSIFNQILGNESWLYILTPKKSLEKVLGENLYFTPLKRGDRGKWQFRFNNNQIRFTHAWIYLLCDMGWYFLLKKSLTLSNTLFRGWNIYI